MNRRNVLKGLAGVVGIAFLEGCVSYDFVRLAEQRLRNIYRIYNELPNHVYTATSFLSSTTTFSSFSL